MFREKEELEWAGVGYIFKAIIVQPPAIEGLELFLG
jgi:hypothetical protein